MVTLDRRFWLGIVLAVEIVAYTWMLVVVDSPVVLVAFAAWLVLSAVAYRRQWP